MLRDWTDRLVVSSSDETLHRLCAGVLMEHEVRGLGRAVQALAEGLARRAVPVSVQSADAALLEMEASLSA